MLKLNEIYNEDCMIGMTKIAKESIDCIISDLPYGVLASSWDKRLPLKELWKQYQRITKMNAAIILFSSNRVSSFSY